MVEEMRGTIIKSIAEQTVNESIDDLNKFRDHRDFEQGLNKIFDEEAHDCQIKADNTGKEKKGIRCLDTPNQTQSTRLQRSSE